MSLPSDKPEKSARCRAGDQIAAGCGCALFIAVSIAVVALFRACGDGNTVARPEFVPVRDTRTPEETAVRRETKRLIEESAQKWTGPTWIWRAPRLGMGAVRMDNFMEHEVVVYFDGPEIFEVVLTPDSRKAVEFQAGAYDIVALSRAPDSTSLHCRMFLSETYHCTFFQGNPMKAPWCDKRAESHELIRRH